MVVEKVVNFDVLLPQEKCAWCGKPFIRKCARAEWGYYARTPHGYMLFCSGPCCKQFEEKQFMQRVQEVYKSRVFKAYMMHKRGISKSEIIKKLGMTSWSGVDGMELHKWQGLKWLEAHGWTA